MLKKSLITFSILIAFGYGVAVGNYKVFPYDLLQRATSSFVDTTRHYRDTSNKHEVPCESIDLSNTMVALAFGQSNSANSAETRYSPKHSVYNFYNGKCYEAGDPLLGATGEKGSVWSRLGDMIIEDDMFSNVILVTVGVEGTPISRWTVDGDLFQRIRNAKTELDAQNIALTHLFWHQGETDGKLGTSKNEYKTMFTDMLNGIRQLNIDAPLYLAVATRCRGPIVQEVHDAQLELIQDRNDVFMGANTDTISDMDDRYNCCHFSESGIKKHTDLWMQAIQ
jgi:hypothetical protein